jgi:RNA polymerase sigma-70 factor (ECF subfamily)
VTVGAKRSDLELVSALLGKNRKAAAEFVLLYSDPIHAYVHQRLIPRADLVDDIVQEVFLAAWGSLERFEGRSTLKTWLLGIARHKVENYYRTRLREPHSLDLDESSLPEIAEEPKFDLAIDVERTMERTRSVLAELPESYSLLLLWRYWEKKSVREMAESIGRTEKAVERALARAREQFRRRWKHVNG